MKLKEQLLNDHKNNLKCFGKIPTYILYVITGLTIILAVISSILNLFFEQIGFIFMIIAMCIAVFMFIYLVIALRKE